MRIIGLDIRAPSPRRSPWTRASSNGWGASTCAVIFWSASAGPLRASFLRVRARRGQHVAAVATARKLAALI
jgi:hypothetical protein